MSRPRHREAECFPRSQYARTTRRYRGKNVTSCPPISGWVAQALSYRPPICAVMGGLVGPLFLVSEGLFDGSEVCLDCVRQGNNGIAVDVIW